MPFSARRLSARPSSFLAADAGFSWPRARAHSELRQLWDYSGFIDLQKEPQTCWAGAKPGPQHPGSCESGSGNHGANRFHTLSGCSVAPNQDSRHLSSKVHQLNSHSWTQDSLQQGSLISKENDSGKKQNLNLRHKIVQVEI